MISPGLVPIRRAGDGRLPVPGWTGAYDWLGTIPAASCRGASTRRRACWSTPTTGWSTTAIRTCSTHDWEPPLRAERIEALLGAGAARSTPTASPTIQLDVTSALAVDFLPFLPPADAVPARAARCAGRAGRLGWRRCGADRPEPLVFAAWYRELGRWHRGPTSSGPCSPTSAPPGPDFLRRVLTQPGWCDESGRRRSRPARPVAFAAAMAGLEQQLRPRLAALALGRGAPRRAGPPPVRGRSRACARGSADCSRSAATQHGQRRRTRARPARASPFGAVHAAGYRAIYDLAQPDASRWIAATGQSGHPLSPHYGDLVTALARWAAICR